MIIYGCVVISMDVVVYYDYKCVVMEVVLVFYGWFVVVYWVVMVEGVGLLVEINLCVNDIVNMGFVEVVDCLVILVVDIDCGGVFVYLVGILELFFDLEWEWVKGFVINCFCGDIVLL